MFTNTLEHVVVPYPKCFRKPKDDRIKTRQIMLPGASRVVRPPVEARKSWENPFRPTFPGDGVEDGSKITMVYDPTRRITDVDPEIEALVRGQGREIPGEVIARHVTRTGPGGDVKIINDLPVPVKAGPQHLLFRMSLATKGQELDARYVTISPEKWGKEIKMAVSFKFECPPLREVREVTSEHR
jgi:hypothetical protein